jgi:hypothetical protein
LAVPAGSSPGLGTEDPRVYTFDLRPYIATDGPLGHALTRRTMRAEIDHLVEETKQSVGLLRRHL